ncbi:uncharacterized protein CLAFUR5_06560 [Fulvia fulva]|uniref:Uncharacterized protein n=1 Tax=Passalora fulva TaxID=5499 RepID=A0A9Q8LGZ2_PASFU|nr:uncharacterized protein CLAFUR5_06560 [Fulvia fulva]KAK4624785.1 hypothetical protein CLAFUR0_06421 [Fulvia fulva]UJO17272.1 hypothetical protein CLAFUR5_06560 [Fulvia fulva]WPV30075.1 hypothetical protein CLAFUW7_06416 [Fulvia fulva]
MTSLACTSRSLIFNERQGRKGKGKDTGQSYSSGKLPIERLCQLVDGMSLLDAQGLELAFHRVEKNALEHEPGEDQALSPFQQKRNLVETGLQSLLPQSVSHELARRGGRSPTSASAQLLAYGATNNFTGLEDLVSPVMIFDYLRPKLVDISDSFGTLVIRHTPFEAIPSVGPLLETQVRRAVEKGDHQAVGALLNRSDATIDVNSQVMLYEGRQLTAIELAARLQHLALTRTLVHLGTDVNKTYDKAYCSEGPRKIALDEGAYLKKYGFGRGALECALYNGRPPLAVSADLVATLLDAGSKTRGPVLQTLLAGGSVAIGYLLLSRCSSADFEGWLTFGAVHEASYHLSESDVCNLVRRLHTNAMNLDALMPRQRDKSERPTVWKIDRFPPSLIDIAIKRGHHNVVTCWYEFGASLTQTPMTVAILSRDSDIFTVVCELTLDNPRRQRVSADHENEVSGPEWPKLKGWSYSDHYRASPFSEALIADRFAHLASCPVDMRNEHEVCVAIAAAAQVDDTRLWQSLLKYIHDDRRGGVLDYALIKAVEKDDTLTALALLQAGASVHFMASSAALGHSGSLDRGLGPPHSLVMAVHPQTKVLVHALLDHNAADGLLFDESNIPVAEAATPGDTFMMQDLIFAGCLTGSGLEHAVKHRNDIFCRAHHDASTTSLLLPDPPRCTALPAQHWLPQDATVISI